MIKFKNHNILPYNSEARAYSRELRKNMTVSEKELWNYLKKNN